MDLSKWTNSSTVWQEGKFNQKNEIFLSTEMSTNVTSPILHDDDVIKCEVSLQGTEYKEALFRKLEIQGKSGAKDYFVSTILFLLVFVVFNLS